MNQADRSLQRIQDEVLEMKSTVEDARKSTYVLVRVLFILLITTIAGLIWG